MQLQRFERREIERPVRDPRTGAVTMRRVMAEVPAVVDHRLDTATALRLHLRRTVAAGTGDQSGSGGTDQATDALVVEVGVSLDANRILSLTRVTAAPGQSLPGPTSAGAAAPRAPGQLRVLSFNIWNFNFWWFRKELALKEITLAQADVRSSELLCPRFCFFIPLSF